MPIQTRKEAADAIRKMIKNIRPSDFGGSNIVNDYSIAVIVAIKHSISELNRSNSLPHKLDIYIDTDGKILLEYGDLTEKLSSDFDDTHIFYHATLQLAVPEDVYLTTAFWEVLLREARLRMTKES